MSVKVLKLIDKRTETQVDSYEDNEAQYLVLTINGQSTFYDRGQAHLLYLYLKERFEPK